MKKYSQFKYSTLTNTKQSLPTLIVDHMHLWKQNTLAWSGIGRMSAPHSVRFRNYEENSKANSLSLGILELPMYINFTQQVNSQIPSSNPLSVFVELRISISQYLYILTRSQKYSKNPWSPKCNLELPKPKTKQLQNSRFESALRTLTFQQHLPGLDRTNQTLTHLIYSKHHPSSSLQSSMRSRIAASIFVTLSGICEAPKGPLKGALRAVATPGSWHSWLGTWSSGFMFDRV